MKYNIYITTRQGREYFGTCTQAEIEGLKATYQNLELIPVQPVPSTEQTIADCLAMCGQQSF